jgi:hypothetical protein
MVAEPSERRLTMNQRACGLFLIFSMCLGLSMLAGVAGGEVRRLKGQTLYVPCLTSYMSGDYSFAVRTTIFIRNTDPDNAIDIVRIDFYNTSGQLVSQYLEKPLKLNPSAATRVHVKAPLSGEEGTATHFVIQWQAGVKVVEPIVRGLMIASAGTRGYSFETEPRLVREITD